MPRTTTVRCPNCAFQFPAPVDSVIDATQNQDGKLLLISGGLNTFDCPNCGAPVRVGGPILYHDASKELLLAYVPPELNLPKQERERVIGDMMRELTAIIPQGSFKSYMFQPRETLTMQGLIDTILEGDGVTPEMMRAQRERMSVLESLLAAPPEMRASIVQQHDALIDAQMMQTLSLLIQRVSAEGRPDVAEQLALAQEEILAHSTFGQSLIADARQQEEVVQEIADRIRALGDQATQRDFMALALEYADDEQKLQALVGLARPAFDYAFFQLLTESIGQAPAADRDRLETLRDRLLELTQAVDQQTQAMLSESTELLRLLVTARDEAQVQALVRENLGALDETFLSVLLANLEQAERTGDQALMNRLQLIYTQVISNLRELMPPELRAVNEAMGAPSESEGAALIEAAAREFGPALLQTIDAIADAMRARGEDAVVRRLGLLREKAALVIDQG